MFKNCGKNIMKNALESRDKCSNGCQLFLNHCYKKSFVIRLTVFFLWRYLRGNRPNSNPASRDVHTYFPNHNRQVVIQG